MKKKNKWEKLAEKLIEDCSESVEVPMVSQHKLGIEMRWMREAAGVTMREVGTYLGNSHAYIGQVEKGKRSIKKEKLAKYIEFCQQD